MTDASWTAAKGRFHLTVDKGESVNLVSFFGAVVTKIATARFQMLYTNLTRSPIYDPRSGAKPVGVAPVVQTSPCSAMARALSTSAPR